jgi:outer membrane protein assembly factor BamD (BamD/ComL family)
MRTKVKLSKQQIKEDKFTTNMLLARDWLTSNWQIVAIAAAVVILIVAGIAYFIKMQSDKEMESGNRLAKAVAEARRQNYQVAILELKAISEEYDGEIGGTALLNLANAYYDNKNYDEAISSYQRFINDFHLDNLTTASAIAGIGYALEGKQEFLAAGDKFAEAVERYPDLPSVGDYCVGAIRNFVQGHDRAKAEKILNILKEKFPGTDYLRVASRLVIQLKTE